MSLAARTPSRRAAARTRFATVAWMFALFVVVPAAAAALDPAAGEVEQVLLLGPEDSAAFAQRVSPVRQYTLGLALADTAVVQQALAAQGFDPSLRLWLGARTHAAQGQVQLAARDIAALQPRAHADSALSAEPAEVLRALDRDRVLLALAAGDTAAAAAALLDPIAGPTPDPRWQACRGAWELATRRPRAASGTFAAAWNQADDAVRRDELFAQRALAALAIGDSLGAARAWLDFVRGLRQPIERNAALAVWDANPGLFAAVDRPGLRLPAARWLARVVRREASLQLALTAWRRGDAAERAGGYVEAAEQLYRLRRNAELQEHLKQPHPSHLNVEQRAALAAYPWGVARRDGASERVAHGFDTVASQYAGSDRAGEALWEAAWVWELADRPATAEQRFVRYLQRYPQAPFADGAAMRAICLPLWRGEPALALKRLGLYEAQLRGGVEEAGSLWGAAQAAAALADSDAAGRLNDRLRARHAHSPFVEPPAAWMALPPAGDGSPDPSSGQGTFASLWGRQVAALGRLATALDAPDAVRRPPEGLAGVERLLQLGMFVEGDRRLLSWTESRGRDPVALMSAAAVAWRCGRPEVQARLGTLLADRVGPERPELRADLDVLGFPTPYAGAVLRVATELQVSPWLLWGLMRRESFFDTQAVSLAGARGLMQLMAPSAAAAAATRRIAAPEPAELFRPLTNLRLGGTLLAGLLQRYHGDPYASLAAYNAGEANAERWGARLRAGRPAAETILLMSYAETRQYVFQVLRHGGVYAASYAAHPPTGLPDSSR